MSIADTAQVLKYAELSSKAYSHHACSVKLSGDSCHFEVQGGTVEIAFKGSHSTEQWMLNLASPARLVFQKEQPSEVRSFETSMNKSIAQELLEKVYRQLSKESHEYDFVVCGHSRGGLLASTAALCLLESGHLVRAVYTYGAPKLYSGYNAHSECLDHLKAIMVSVVHVHDPVPKALDLMALNYDLGECTCATTTLRLRNAVKGRAVDQQLREKNRQLKRDIQEERTRHPAMAVAMPIDDDDREEGRIDSAHLKGSSLVSHTHESSPSAPPMHDDGAKQGNSLKGGDIALFGSNEDDDDDDDLERAQRALQEQRLHQQTQSQTRQQSEGQGQRPSQSQSTAGSTISSMLTSAAFSYLSDMVTDAVSTISASHSITDSYIAGLQELLANQTQGTHHSHDRSYGPQLENDASPSPSDPLSAPPSAPLVSDYSYDRKGPPTPSPLATGKTNAAAVGRSSRTDSGSGNGSYGGDGSSRTSDEESSNGGGGGGIMKQASMQMLAYAATTGLKMLAESRAHASSSGSGSGDVSTGTAQQAVPISRTRAEPETASASSSNVSGSQSGTARAVQKGGTADDGWGWGNLISGSTAATENREGRAYEEGASSGSLQSAQEAQAAQEARAAMLKDAKDVSMKALAFAATAGLKLLSESRNNASEGGDGCETRGSGAVGTQHGSQYVEAVPVARVETAPASLPPASNNTKSSTAATSQPGSSGRGLWGWVGSSSSSSSSTGNNTNNSNGGGASARPKGGASTNRGTSSNAESHRDSGAAVQDASMQLFAFAATSGLKMLSESRRKSDSNPPNANNNSNNNG